MKISSICVIIPLLAFSGCKPKQESASTSSTAVEITAAAPSPHFAEVMSHLDVGGKALHYEDHEGRREFWIGLIDMIMTVVPKDEFPVKINAAEMVDEGGFMDAAASGRSLSKDGEGWLLRHYISYPKGLPEMMNILGKKQEFMTASRLPDSTDLSLEARVNATVLPKIIRTYGKMLGQEKEIEKGLKELSPFGADIETLLAGMDLHILLGLDIEPTLIPQMPVMPKNVFLQVSAKKVLIDLLMPVLGEGLGEATTVDGMKAWPLPIPPFPGLAVGTPHLVYDGETSLTVVSSLEYFKEVRGDGKKLADQPFYQAATNNFSSSGNVLFYASPAIAEAALEWIAISAADTPEMAPMLTKLNEWNRNLPWSVYVSCEDKGLITMAKIPYALDSNATTTLAMLSATSTLFIGARAWKNGSDRATCILQTRNMQQAVRALQNMNALKIGDPLDWNEIFGPDKFIENKPTCPEGGTFTFVDTIPKIGTLAGHCSHEDHVPANHQDW